MKGQIDDNLIVIWKSFSFSPRIKHWYNCSSFKQIDENEKEKINKLNTKKIKTQQTF